MLDYRLSEIRPIVGEAWIGATAQLTKAYRLSWVLRYQTPELRDGPGDRDPLWGSVFFSRDL